MFKKIFIHIPKNAGTTIRLNPEFADKIVEAGPSIHKSKEYSAAVKAHMDSIGDHHGYQHARWRDLDRRIAESMEAFAIVRNPWDRVVSRYFFAKKLIEVEKKEPVGKHKIDSLEHFLEERFEWGNMEYMWHRAVRGWYNQKEYVIDEEGKVRCNIIRLEHFDREIPQYLGVNNLNRRRNVTALNKQSYQEIYTPKTIQIVADWYKDDIDYWGFDFDSPATKNTWALGTRA